MFQEELIIESHTSIGGDGESKGTVRQKQIPRFSQHPFLKGVGGRVRATLENARGGHRVLRYIQESHNPQIISLLNDVTYFDYAPLLLEFLPLLEQIYRFKNNLESIAYIDQYKHLLGGEQEKKVTREELLALARIQQIVKGKILHGKEVVTSPSDFVDDHLQEHIYDLNSSQLAGVLLVIELIHRRISYLTSLRKQHGDNPRTLFAEVKEIDFKEKTPIKGVSQQGPFLQFSVSRGAMTLLRSQLAAGLFYRSTKNKILRHALVLIEGYVLSTENHEKQHHVAAWGSLEKMLCMRGFFYFDTKDEILAFLAGGDRSLYAIFRTMFTSHLYDPHMALKNNASLYDIRKEDYRKKLLGGLVCAKLLENQIGRRDTIDILAFIHFRSWGSELKRIFDIEISPALELLINSPGKEKNVFSIIN